nr:hypothetical protein [Mesorhizobium sp.]
MKPIILAAPILLFAAGSAVAEDRAPTAEESVRVEAALRADGYTDWGDIGLNENRA